MEDKYIITETDDRYIMVEGLSDDINLIYGLISEEE